MLLLSKGELGASGLSIVSYDRSMPKAAQYFDLVHLDPILCTRVSRGGGRSIGGDRNALLTSAKQSRSLLVQQQRGFAHDLGAGSNQEQQLVFVRDCEGCPCPHQRVKHVRPFQIQPPLEGDLPLPRPAECHVRGTPQRKFQDGFHLGHSSINRSIHFILLDF